MRGEKAGGLDLTGHPSSEGIKTQIYKLLEGQQIPWNSEPSPGASCSLVVVAVERLLHRQRDQGAWTVDSPSRLVYAFAFEGTGTALLSFYSLRI